MPLFARTAEAFLHSRKPVRTMEDLKGLKLRTAGAWLEISKSLGAASVTTPGPETYPMLERGAIDATEWGTLVRTWRDRSPDAGPGPVVAWSSGVSGSPVSAK